MEAIIAKHDGKRINFTVMRTAINALKDQTATIMKLLIATIEENVEEEK